MLNTGPSVISFTVMASCTLAFDFMSHVAHLLMGKLGGYGAFVLDGAPHLAGMTPVGLHASAISGHVVLVGMRAMFRKSACVIIGISDGCSTGRACWTGFTLRLQLQLTLQL